jgi:hypothetical protein
MTDRRRLLRPGRLRAYELAFLYRDTPERERQLGGGPNWRSVTGIRRKGNAGWGAAGTGVLHRVIGAVRNAGWGVVGTGVLHRVIGAVRNAGWMAGGGRA